MDQISQQVSQQAPQQAPHQAKTQIDTRKDTRIKKYEELSVDTQIFGIDKNLLITFSAVGVSLMFSVYLFREFKKIRDDIRSIKNQQPDEDLISRVEENSESVKAIEIKFDQLITALNARERRMQQKVHIDPQMDQQVMAQRTQQAMAQQAMAQQAMAQQESEQQSDHIDPQILKSLPVIENEVQNQQIIQQHLARQLAQQQQQQIENEKRNAREHMETKHQNSQNPQREHNQIPIMGGGLSGNMTLISIKDEIKL